MKAIIDLSEVEDQLTDCKPGDEYSIVFTVDQKTPEELTGTASAVEHLGEEGSEEEEGSYAEEPEPSRTVVAARRVPKAIMMVSK